MLRHCRARTVVAFAATLSVTLGAFGLWAAIVGIDVNLLLLAIVVFVSERAGLQGRP